jgi:hypothetical protein
VETNKRAILIVRLENEGQQNRIAHLLVGSAEKGAIPTDEAFSLASKIHLVGDLSVRAFGRASLLVISSNILRILAAGLSARSRDPSAAIGITSDFAESLLSVSPDVLETVRGLASLAAPGQVLCTSNIVEMASQAGASVHAAGTFEIWWDRRIPVFLIAGDGPPPRTQLSRSPGFSTDFPVAITDHKGGILQVTFDECITFAQVQFETDTGLVVTSESLGSSGLSFAFDFTAGSAQREQRFRLEARKVDSDNKQVVIVKAFDEFGCTLGPVRQHVVAITKIGRLSLKSLLGEKGEAIEIAWRSLAGSSGLFKVLIAFLLFTALTIAGLIVYYFRFLPEDYSHKIANAALLYFDVPLPRLQAYGSSTDLAEWFPDMNRWEGGSGWALANDPYPEPGKTTKKALMVAGNAAGWLRSPNPLESYFENTAEFAVTLDGEAGQQPTTKNIVWGLRGGLKKPHYEFLLQLPEPGKEKLFLKVSCEDCHGFWGDRPLLPVGIVPDGSKELAGRKWESGYGLRIRCVAECWGFKTVVTYVGDWAQPRDADPIEFDYFDPYERLDSGSFGFGGPHQAGSMIVRFLKITQATRSTCHDWHVLPAGK